MTMPTEAAAQGIGEHVYQRSRITRTETGEDARPHSKYETNVEGLGPRRAQFGRERPPRDRQLPLTNTALLRSVPAVVTGIDEHSVIITCQLPRGDVEVRLPRAVVPSNLAVFGSTVSLSLDESSGFKRPVLIERQIEPRERTPEEIEIDDWIES